MKTSEAEKNGGRCPKCNDETTQDLKGRGFVRHKSNRKCKHGHGEKD